jgi:hypothetical protein
MDFLDDRLPWFLLGPALGLLVLGFLAVLNLRLGVMGGWSDAIDRADGRSRRLSWKGWFAVGVVAGGLAFRLLAGVATTGSGGYGWLGAEISSPVVVGMVLAGAGVLIGYGAKTAGGCTSGNGLGGTSFGSAAGLAATATFMGTAVVASLVIEVLT